MNLYCNSPERTITDGDGQKYTVEDAYRLRAEGHVEDYNMALGRLLDLCGGDWDELERQYSRFDAQREHATKES